MQALAKVFLDWEAKGPPAWGVDDCVCWGLAALAAQGRDCPVGRSLFTPWRSRTGALRAIAAASDGRGLGEAVRRFAAAEGWRMVRPEARQRGQLALWGADKKDENAVPAIVGLDRGRTAFARIHAQPGLVPLGTSGLLCCWEVG